MRHHYGKMLCVLYKYEEHQVRRKIETVKILPFEDCTFSGKKVLIFWPLPACNS